MDASARALGSYLFGPNYYGKSPAVCCGGSQAALNAALWPSLHQSALHCTGTANVTALHTCHKLNRDQCADERVQSWPLVDARSASLVSLACRPPRTASQVHTYILTEHTNPHPSIGCALLSVCKQVQDSIKACYQRLTLFDIQMWSECHWA